MRLLVVFLLFGLLAVALAATKKGSAVAKAEMGNAEDITAVEEEEKGERTTPRPKKKAKTPKKESAEEETEAEVSEKPKVVKKKKSAPKKQIEETQEKEPVKKEPKKKAAPKKKKKVTEKEADELEKKLEKDGLQEAKKPTSPKKTEKVKEEQTIALERILKKTEEAKKKRSESLQIRVAADIVKLAAKIEREAEEIVKRALVDEARKAAEELELKKKREEARKAAKADEELEVSVQKRRDEDLTQLEKKKSKKAKVGEKKARDLKVGNFVMLKKKPTKLTRVEIEEKKVKLEGQDVFKNKKVKAIVKTDEIFKMLNNVIKEYRLISINEKKATLMSMDGKETKKDVPFANDAIFKKISEAQKAGKRLIISLLSLGEEQLIESHH